MSENKASISVHKEALGLMSKMATQEKKAFNLLMYFIQHADEQCHVCIDLRVIEQEFSLNESSINYGLSYLLLNNWISLVNQKEKKYALNPKYFMQGVA